MSVVVGTTALAAALALAVAGVVWRRRDVAAAARPLVVLLLGSALWSTAVVLNGGIGVPAAVLGRLSVLHFAGIASVVLGLRLFVDVLAGRPAARGRVLLLAVEPVLVVALAVADPWLGLLHDEVVLAGDPPVLLWQPGPAFWLHATYGFAVIAWCVVDLVHARRHVTGALRLQVETVLVATALPLVCNVVDVVAWLPIDVTPSAFCVSGLLIAWSVLRHDLLRLVPVARSLVVDTLTDAVLVLDGRGRVVDLNPAARTLLARAHPDGVADPVGSRLDDVVPARLRAAVGEGEGESVAHVGDLSLDVRTRRILDHRSRALGRVVVLREVTEALEQRHALVTANVQLRDHVATIERLRADLADEASRDPLTGLRNRRRFVEDLRERLDAATAAGEPVSLVLLDLDHFKGVNDTYGHSVGDQVLVGVAQALLRHARAEDVVRYGGEELVVLLPRLTAEEAAVRAEQLRLACARVRVEVEDVRVTISAGVATAPQHGTTPDELLLAADRALYAAKAAGRDRVALAT